MMRNLLLVLCFIHLLFFTGCSNKDNIAVPDIQSVDDNMNHVGNKLESGLSEFINKANNGISFSAKFSFGEGYETKNTILISNKVKELENGIIYELLLNKNEEFQIKRFPIFLYIQSEKAYRIWADSEQISQMETEADIIKNSVIVYQEQALNDELAKEEQGIHHYILIDEDIIESHYYQLNDYANVVGYYETFHWERGKGLSLYRSGFGAEADLLELKLNNI